MFKILSRHVTLFTFMEIIAHMICSGSEELAPHGQSLMGPRLRGSTTDFGLENIDRTTLCRQVIHEAVMPGCLAYRLNLPKGMVGLLGAVEVDDLTADQKKMVKSRNGEHGPEKFLDIDPSAVELPEVNFITIITGPASTKSGRAVYTWHPGYPLDPTKAVKLHNGGAAAQA